jgi:uncharacterized Zn-binding protein involved in type VI secretion
MAALSRKGDTDEPGGAIMRGAATVFCNGIPVGLHVSPISPHAPWDGPHGSARTTEGSPTVFAEGCQVLRIGSGNTCGHRIIQGSKDVFVP